MLFYPTELFIGNLQRMTQLILRDAQYKDGLLSYQEATEGFFSFSSFQLNLSRSVTFTKMQLFLLTPSFPLL